MARKKTNYEKKGLVRQLAGSILAPIQSRDDGKWRPRKTQFERLDLDDDDISVAKMNVIHRAFSVESETTDYRRGNHFEKKKVKFNRKQNQKKRDLGDIVIKPSSRDIQALSRNTPGRTKKETRKEVSHQTDFFSGFEKDPFDAIFHHSKCDESIDDSISRNTHSSFHTGNQTISSDPTDLFSAQPMMLTKSNLDAIAASSKVSGIENTNPRSKFHQFTIDEDKESTIIEPVFGSFDDHENVSRNDETLEDDSIYSLGYTSKGTLIQNQAVRPSTKTKTETTSKSSKGDSFFPSFDGLPENSFEDQGAAFVDSKPSVPEKFFPAFDDAFQDPGPVRRDPSQQFQSSHSLVYSESTFGDGFAGTTTTTTAAAAVESQSNAFLDAENNGSQGRRQSGGKLFPRTPFSPVNFSNSPITRSVLHNKSQIKTKKSKPDPDASWAAFSNGPFESKPDPKGIEISNETTSFFNTMQNSAVASSTNDFIKPAVEADDESETHYEYGFTLKRSIDEVDMPIGIQRLPPVSDQSQEASVVSGYSSRKSRSSSSKDITTSLYGSNSHQSRGSHSGFTTYSEKNDDSMPKPFGLPNNAIMASMLFRRHHNIDPKVVEAKLKEKEKEYKIDKRRGDIPQSIQAMDGVSMVSSFSEDTGAQMDIWNKPTRDLLDHFSRSRRSNVDFKKRIQEQRNAAPLTDLFEA